MSIKENGIWTGNQFIEAGAYEIYSPQSYSYTPTTGTNRTLGYWTIDFQDWIEEGQPLTIRVECDVEFSGFDSSNTSGTFAMRWQGASYEKSTSSWVWTTGSPVAAALQNQQALTTLVNEKNGSFHYNNSYTITSTWLSTYTQTELGIRTDYSNGTGTITMKNLKVYLERYYGGEKVKITDDQVLAANNFIEI